MANVIDRRSHASYTRNLVISEGTEKKERSDETHLSTKRFGTQASSRFPFTHGHSWWSPRDLSPPCKRPGSPVSVIVRPRIPGFGV